MQGISIRGEKDVLDTFKSLLVDRVLSNRQAEVYITLISLGQASASEIHEKIKDKPRVAGIEKISKSVVYIILNELEQRGFIKSALKSGIKSHSKPFRPVSPEEALAQHFSETEQLKDISNQVVTLLELKEKGGSKANKQDIWMHETRRVALNEGLKQLEGAKKAILMYCNDYSWIEESGIAEVLTKKIKERIDVRILGKTPAPTLQTNLSQFNAVRKETSIPCNPYCIVDDEQLLTFLNDGFNPKLLITKNTYMVMRHSAQFKEIWQNHSKKGVK